MGKIKKIFTHPEILAIEAVIRTAKFWSDKRYLSTLYRLKFGKKLEWENPKTFNEKIQWLKLYDRQPRYTKMVDKVAVKDFVAKIIGEEYIIPTLGVWERAEDIDFDSLPQKFVIKCNHNSGLGMYICTDKSKMDVEKVRDALKKGINEDYFISHREWPYKNVPRRILAEQFLEDGGSGGLKDYKFFCFGGKVHFCKVDFDRFIDHHANYYDTDWNLLEFGELSYPPNPERIIEKPEAFSQMIELAERLAAGTTFVRVDFYNLNGRIYFGEITFYPASGLGLWTPESQDLILGQKIQLPLNNAW